MKHAPVVLLAKFVPDIHRMEPKNIGVVVWDNGNVAHQFLGAHRSGIITPPRMVPEDSRHAYREWIKYWQLQLARDDIRKRDGTLVERDSPEFLSVLSSKSKPQFMMVECAKLFDELNGNLNQARDEFFNRLVKSTAEPKPPKQSAIALEAKCKTVIRDVGLRPDYCHAKQHVVTEQDGAWQDFQFDFVLQKIKLDALLQRVVLDNARSVASTSWMFQWVQNSRTVSITDNQCATLIDTSLHDMQDRSVRGSIKVLERLSQVIDVADQCSAAVQVESMALSL